MFHASERPDRAFQILEFPILSNWHQSIPACISSEFTESPQNKGFPSFVHACIYQNCRKHWILGVRACVEQLTRRPYKKHTQGQRTCTVSPHEHCMPHMWSTESSVASSLETHLNVWFLKTLILFGGSVFEHKLFKFLDIRSKEGGVDSFVGPLGGQTQSICQTHNVLSGKTIS